MVHLEEAAEVCREHPDLRIVLNHTGYPLKPIQRAACGLETRNGGAGILSTDVWCKISGLGVAGKPWTLRSTALSFEKPSACSA